MSRTATVQLAIVEAIGRGGAEIQAGQSLATDEVFQGAEAAIAGVEADQAAR